MGQSVVFSGIQPTGNLHVGNYLGAVKQWVDLQNQGQHQCFFCIVDYHSLTGSIASAKRQQQIWTLAAELLALGIDPSKSTIFIQSEVPEHTELAWIFSAITPISELYRMTQFKDKTGASDSFVEIEKALKTAGDGDSALSSALAMRILSFFRTLNKNNVGLLTYPVLQAADILLYHANFVPVGADQVQHIELTRDIARWFNKRYGTFFPETKALLTRVPKVMSLLLPEKKMSKSHGEASVIELADEPEVVERKLKKAVTATTGGTTRGVVAPGVANLFVLLEQFGSQDIARDFVAAEKDGSIRYGELKLAVAHAIATNLAEFRERRKELLAHPKRVRDAFSAGREKARAVAAKTISEVRRLVGVS